MPGIFQAGLRLRREWPRLDGRSACGCGLEPHRLRCGSVSVWESEKLSTRSWPGPYTWTSCAGTGGGAAEIDYLERRAIRCHGGLERSPPIPVGSERAREPAGETGRRNAGRTVLEATDHYSLRKIKLIPDLGPNQGSSMKGEGGSSSWLRTRPRSLRQERLRSESIAGPPPQSDHVMGGTTQAPRRKEDPGAGGAGPSEQAQRLTRRTELPARMRPALVTRSERSSRIYSLTPSRYWRRSHRKFGVDEKTVRAWAKEGLLASVKEDPV